MDHFDPDEIEELLAQERLKKSQSSKTTSSVEQTVDDTPVVEPVDYYDPGMDMETDLPMGTVTEKPKNVPKNDTPNIVSAWFSKKVAERQHKKNLVEVKKQKDLIKQSQRALEDAGDALKNVMDPTHAITEEDKMVKREKKAQKQLGKAAAPIVLDTDHINNIPPGKPNGRLLAPANTKVYTAIVLVGVIVTVLAVRPQWVGQSFAVVGGLFTPKPTVVAPPAPAPVAPVQPTQPTAPVTTTPAPSLGPTNLPPPPPAPPTALPGEVPNYANFDVPKDAVFEKPNAASIGRAQQAAKEKVKPQKTQEQIQEEQERRMLEEQMKKLDAWGNR